jgi:outer membrane biosynthesis protein TonB
MRKASLLGCLSLLLVIHYPGPTQEKSCPRHIEPPRYPPIARAAHVSGSVVVKLTIRSDGKVSDASVVNTADR